MAETKTSISELTAATTVGTTDLLFVSQLNGSSYVSKKATVSQLPFGQGTITGITMNGASKGTSGNVNLGTVLTAHQSLTGYYTKAELTGTSGVLKDYSLTSHTHSDYVPTSRKINGTQLTADLNVGTVTGITMNGASKGTSGVVNLGTVLTAHQSLAGYVPTSRKVNNKQLSTDVTLNAADVSAVALTGNSTISGELAVRDGVATSGIGFDDWNKGLAFDDSGNTAYFWNPNAVINVPNVTADNQFALTSDFTAYYTKAELTGTAGVLTSYSLTSHTHTGYASSTHTHGNITNAGAITAAGVDLANGDSLAFVDSSDSSKVKKTSITFDGSTTTQFLSKKGTFETALTAHQSLANYYTKSELTGTTGVLTGYSLTSHTHTGYVPTSRKVAGQALTADVTAATISSAIGLSNYSLTSHNHSGVYAPATHAHGNIQSGGTLQTTDVTIANGDKLVVTDSSDSNKVARTSIAFDGSTTTQFLSKKGTWESASVTGYVSKAELTAAVAAVGTVPSGDGATLSAVIDKYNALVAALTALAT